MRLRRSLICLTTLSILAVAPAAEATHTTFAAGDVFVGVGNSKVQWRHPDGSLNQTLTTAVSSPSTTGMALDLSHNLYVTGYTANAISTFDSNGAAIGTFGGGFNSHPESIAFDTNGFAYVGEEGGSRDIIKINPSGMPVAAFNAAPAGNRGTDRLDVAGDQCTIFYTGETKAIKRFDACGNGQLPDLTSNLPGTKAYDVKILVGKLPGGAVLDGQVLVADTGAIYRLSPSGTVVQSYDSTGTDCWTALALDTVTTSFWAGDRCGSRVVKFDMSTGSQLASFTAGPKTSVQGLAVNEGLTAATAADVSVSMTDLPDPVSPSSTTEASFVRYQALVTNLGHGLARGVAFTGSTTNGTIHSISGQGWSCPTQVPLGGTSATCTLSAASLGAGVPASLIDMVVRVGLTGPGTLSGTGVVDANEPDPNTANNTDTETTTVEPAQAGHVVSFCPGTGCAVDTDPTNGGPNNQDNTVTRIEAGAGTAGAVVTADEVFPAAFECGSPDSSQQINFAAVAAGGGGPGRTFRLIVTMDSSSGVGGNPSACTDKNGDQVPEVLPSCDAAAPPCLDRVTVLGGGRVQTQILIPEGDPPIKH